MTVLLSALTWIVIHVRKNLKVYLYIAAGLALLLLLVIAFRSCGKSKAKVDLETVDKINSKNEAEAKKAVRKTVEENMDVATTVDNRSTLAEVNIIERERLLEEKIKVVDRQIAEARAQGQDITQEQLQCLLVPSDCQ